MVKWSRKRLFVYQKGAILMSLRVELWIPDGVPSREILQLMPAERRVAEDLRFVGKLTQQRLQQLYQQARTWGIDPFAE
jgi:hypothetical protein